ncbi:LysM peptidoglycan-binding domain-containing protein [Rhizobium grahamii]|nr:Ig-like domain-containing protein [Rhizobium grahamii]
MMRNRAGLLALAVLVVAILLMVFFVMPRIGGDAAKVGDAINQAGSEVKKTVNESAKTSRPAAPDDAATTQTVGRLASEAGQAISELKALFADGKGPTQEVFEAAKSKATTSLQTLADLAIPDGTNPVTAAAATKAKNGAAKALTIIKALPENTADAVMAVAKAEATLTGSAETGTAASQPSPAATPTENASNLPTFDVLRVEPDGSTVIAGSAEPNSKLEIVDGDKVVTTTNVGPTGDFAAVLDNPLAAGDHQLVLRATGKDGKASTSEEVATVSVPKDGKSSELLAMVSKPGTASRIITAPKPDAQVASNGNVAPSDQPAAPAQTPGSPDVANAPAAAGAQPGPAAAADVMVNAVEIEGDKIFVAGMAKPLANVIAYADDKMIGKAKAGPDGHFVVDGVMPLSVGDHKIRVDVLDDAGKVAVRASVNFNRPEGNQVTVAAQGAGSTPGTSPATVPLDESALGKLKSDASKAFSLLNGLFADGKIPGAEQLAAARSANEFALRAITEFRPAADATADFKQQASTAAQTAAGALKTVQALPKDAKSVGAALGKLGADIAQLTGPEEAPSTPVTNEVASGQGEPTTIEQAPLAPSNETVIIRRGDTLWQISRRIYGAGVRYTTIYVANEDKIPNPDRILPGQIFGLPKDALPNAEELHRKRMHGEHL